MRSLDSLKRMAQESTRYRGHTMSLFNNISSTVAESTCASCGLAVMVKADPLPNEVDIGGPAVAVDCVDKVFDAAAFIDELLRD